MAEVTVIIPTYGQQGLLASLLADLGRQTRPLKEIVVIDNCSPDDSVAVATGAGARVIQMDANVGFARAVNRGVEVAATDYIAVLNNDVELAPDWLERLVQAIETTGAWFATGKILRHAEPGILDGTYDAVSRAGCGWRCGEGRPDGPLWDTPSDTFFAPFTAAVFRTELFRRIGGLDERFESYLEDVDFGLRCAAAGCAGRYVPQAVARHHGSATLGRWSRRKVRLMSRNQVLLIAKHFPRHWWLRLGWPVLIGQVLWGLVAARHGAALDFCRGKWDALRLTGKLRRESVPAPAMMEILTTSEETIRRLQQATGFDRYWRWYFRLT